MQKKIAMLIVVTLSGTTFLVSPRTTFAKESDGSQLEAPQACKEATRKNVELFYSYTDFNFDSTSSINFNRFQGHSNLYGIGGGYTWSSSRNVGTGIYLFNIDTTVNSQFLIAPAAQTNLNQSIKNQTLLASFFKPLDDHTFVNLAGAYGINSIDSQIILGPDTTTPNLGFGKSHNNNWFISLTGIYIKPWKALSFNNNVRLLYSQSNSGNFVFNFPTGFPSTFINPLKTNVSWLMESTELDYNYKPNVTPFVVGGLLQVLNYSTSNPLVTTTVIGSLPQLSTNQNGYWVGGGMNFKYKQLTTRIEYKYFSSVGTYSSNQALVGLNYDFT